MKLPAATLAQSTLATVALISGTVSAQAHSGHGLHEVSTSHILSSPYHLAVLAISGAVMLLVARLVQRSLPRRFLQAAGVAALVAVVVLWGLRA